MDADSQQELGMIETEIHDLFSYSRRCCQFSNLMS